MDGQAISEQQLLLSAFFPPAELDAMIDQMKSISLEMTKEESALFTDVEQAYNKLIIQYICRPAMLIKFVRPDAPLDEIIYSGTMTMLCMFEMYLRKGQEKLKT